MSYRFRARNLSVVTALALVFALAPAAHAGITGMDIAPGSDISSLFLSDGTWDEDDDWGVVLDVGDAIAWMNETWTSGNPADFDIDVTTDGQEGFITLTKTVTNMTSFDWLDFHMTLTPISGPGELAVDQIDVFSDGFSISQVMSNPDGSFMIWFFVDQFKAGDIPIGFGDDTTFEITFSVTDDLLFNLEQHPTPEPAGLFLLAAGGLLIRRKR